MDTAILFDTAYPGVFYLNPSNPQLLQDYLHRKGFLLEKETILNIQKAGEGNMNCTLRVRTQNRSFIVKQARPWVEKYPQIVAPTERMTYEIAYYSLIATNTELQKYSANVLFSDETAFLIVLEDLGEASDYTSLYHKNTTLDINELQSLLKYISVLHHNFNSSSIGEKLPNLALRSLNHEHIFIYPFTTNNGLNLDDVQPGLQAIAIPYQQDETLKVSAQKLGKIYLDGGNTLLHGDFYPGSWLHTTKGLKVIDPEFCHTGKPEFEVGVLTAHLYLAQQPTATIDYVHSHYIQPVHFNMQLCKQFTGIEIMRRLIGLAQLPLSLSVAEKALLLQQAAHLINNH